MDPCNASKFSGVFPEVQVAQRCFTSPNCFSKDPFNDSLCAGLKS